MKHDGFSDSILLSTKLKMPAPRRNYIVRSELFSMLRSCSSLQIIYVKGAAGMGKTTLLSSFIKETGLEKTAWLTLDETNNNVFSFWHYFAAAAEDFLGDAFADILSLLRSNFDGSKIQDLLALMINRLCDDQDYYLVLDDMQFIKDKTLIGSIEFFLKAMPENLHIFMLSREEPALYLGEFAVSGRLLFIDGDKLRFSPTEGMQFLQKTLALPLDDSELSKMNDFAEGWIGGLQLVAAAGGAHSVLLRTAGSGIAADYLTREIFHLLRDDERHFLTVTGILSYFDRDICSFITGEIDFEQMIAQLTAKNLFITCVDEENGVYRYHNILGEYLKQQFSLLPQKEQTDYRRKAAKALEAKGDPQGALHQLFKTEDYDDAIRILKGMDATVETWALIDRLPTDRVMTDIDLAFQCLMYNFAIMNVSRSRELYLALMEQKELQIFQGCLQYVFDVIIFSKSTPLTVPNPFSLPDIEKWHMSPVTQSLLFFENANILLDQKKYDEAAAFTDYAIKAGGNENIFVSFYAISTKAQIFEETGQLNQSIAIYDDMKKHLSSAAFMDALGYNYYISSIGVYHKRMEKANAKAALEALRAQLDRGLAQNSFIELFYQYHIAEYELLFADEKKASRIILELAEGYFASNLSQLSRLIYGILCRELLDDGVCEKFLKETEKFGYENGSLISQLLCARILWNRGHKEQAKELLESILSFSRANHNRFRLIEADLFKIRILLSESGGQQRTAANLLREAIYYAWENRIISPFFLERSVICPFLEAFLKPEEKNMGAGERQFIRELYKICSGTDAVTEKELLSARELEVLCELAKGLTNPEIAEALCISLATVKTHIVNIYGKLGVSSRLKAIEKAKACGLIGESIIF